MSLFILDCRLYQPAILPDLFSDRLVTDTSAKIIGTHVKVCDNVCCAMIPAILLMAEHDLSIGENDYQLLVFCVERQIENITFDGGVFLAVGIGIYPVMLYLAVKSDLDVTTN